MEKVSINGVNLAYETYGVGPCNLLFVHGYLGRSTNQAYAGLYKLLAQNFRIIALDLRGHGASAGITENFTLDQLAEDIVKVSETLELDKPLYVGHSLGALLGLLSELKVPGLFRGLIMLAPAAATGAKGSNAENVNRALKYHRNRKKMRDNIRAIHVRDIPEAELDAIVDTACLVDPSIHRRYLNVEFPNIDITDRLNEITAQVLSLAGALDNVIPLASQHQTALGITHFKEVIFSDEGHMLPLEAPERTAQEIIRFYQDQIA